MAKESDLGSFEDWEDQLRELATVKNVIQFSCGVVGLREQPTTPAGEGGLVL